MEIEGTLGFLTEMAASDEDASKRRLEMSQVYRWGRVR